MDHHHFLTGVLILLVVSAATITLFKRLGLGSILGLLAAGIIVGPSGLALIGRAAELRQVTEIGVAFLLFLIGLEMHFDKLWSLRREVLGLGTLQMLLTAALLALCSRLLGQQPWNVAVFFGLSLALSSTAFVMQLLAERGELAADHGRSAFGILLLQDLAVVPLLILVPFLAGAPAAGPAAFGWKKLSLIAGVLLAIGAGGRYVVPWILDRLAHMRHREAFTLVTVVAVIGAAWGAEQAGLSMALGAFLLGMLLSRCRYRYQIESTIEPWKGLCLSLFFIAVGMSMDLSVLADAGLGLAGRLGTFFGIKGLILFGLGLAFGLRRGAAVRLSLLLAQGGEFAFVLLGAAAGVRLIDERAFAGGVLFVSITMAGTPLLVKLADFLAARLDTPAAAEAGLPAGPEQQFVRHVVVAGYGRVGQHVCRVLGRAGVPYLAFDLNPRKVKLAREAGQSVYFGDIGRPELLHAGRLAEAAALVVTIDDMPVARSAISAARHFFPELPIVARARHLAARDELLAAGATCALPTAAEASLRLAESTLLSLKVARDEVSALVESLRQDDYRGMRAAPAAAAPAQASE